MRPKGRDHFLSTMERSDTITLVTLVSLLTLVTPEPDSRKALWQSKACGSQDQDRLLKTILWRRLRDSFSAVTRMALLPRTGHSCSQIPQPMQFSGFTYGC